MKILIYGAGVIGSILAVKFSEAGYNVSVFARGNRLQVLLNEGLLYNDNASIKKANVNVISALTPDAIFDYIIVCVRYEQIETALADLKDNKSPNIVTMVNNPKGYALWEALVGKGRLIPGFPGAGGRIEDNILHYKLTPKIIQAATFGEIDGKQTERVKILKRIFTSSKIPCSVSKNMDAWQKSHLAMVTVLANGIYLDGGDNFTTAKNKEALHFMSTSLKKNFKTIQKSGIPITPSKLKIFVFCPLWIMNLVLRFLYNTQFAAALINSHAQSAKEEMKILDNEFRLLLEQ